MVTTSIEIKCIVDGVQYSCPISSAVLIDSENQTEQSIAMADDHHHQAVSPSMFFSTLFLLPQFIVFVIFLLSYLAYRINNNNNNHFYNIQIPKLPDWLKDDICNFIKSNKISLRFAYDQSSLEKFCQESTGNNQQHIILISFLPRKQTTTATTTTTRSIEHNGNLNRSCESANGRKKANSEMEPLVDFDDETNSKRDLLTVPKKPLPPSRPSSASSNKTKRSLLTNAKMAEAASKISAIVNEKHLAIQELNRQHNQKQLEIQQRKKDQEDMEAVINRRRSLSTVKTTRHQSITTPDADLSIVQPIKTTKQPLKTISNNDNKISHSNNENSDPNSQLVKVTTPLGIVTSQSDNKTDTPLASPAPPPPPPLPPTHGTLSGTLRFPKPSRAVKCFNWVPLPDFKIRGTIWENTKKTWPCLLKRLDLVEIEEIFCQKTATRRSSTPRPDSRNGGSSLGIGLVPRREVFSVIDSRRAHNLNILLSSAIRLPVQELVQLISTMDPNNSLSTDVCTK